VRLCWLFNDPHPSLHAQSGTYNSVPLFAVWVQTWGPRRFPLNAELRTLAECARVARAMAIDPIYSPPVLERPGTAVVADHAGAGSTGTRGSNTGRAVYRRPRDGPRPRGTEAGPAMAGYSASVQTTSETPVDTAAVLYRLTAQPALSLLWCSRTPDQPTEMVELVPKLAAGSLRPAPPHEDCDHGYLLGEAVRDRSTILMGCGGSPSSFNRTSAPC
jgi:hypothetical protein